MPTSYRITICQHAIDGLRLAARDLAAQTGKRVIIVPRDSGVAALFCGRWCSQDYPGIAGLLRYEVEELGIPFSYAGAASHIMLAPPQMSAQPWAELFDRLRVRLEGWSVGLVLGWKWLDEDLPPLVPQDHLACAWEARDYLGESHLQAVSYLVDRVNAEGPTFAGFGFYQREGGTVSPTRLQSLQKALGVADQPLMLL